MRPIGATLVPVTTPEPDSTAGGPMRRVTRLVGSIAAEAWFLVWVVVGDALVLLCVVAAVPVWCVAVLPLWLVRLVSGRQFRLTLPAFMAWAAQLMTTALSRTVLRRSHAGNLEQWPLQEPPRRLRDGLV